MLNTFVKWITSSESRPYINLKYKDLEALTEELISKGDTKSIEEIRKELGFRKFTKVSLLIEKVETYIVAAQRPQNTDKPTTQEKKNKATDLATHQEYFSKADEPDKTASFGLHIKRVVSYKLMEGDSDALFTPVRDDSGITIRINKSNPLGSMIYEELTRNEENGPRLLGLLIEALAEYEIEEVGRTKRDMALLRRAIGKKFIMKAEH